MTPTPKDPVDALMAPHMELASKYALACVAQDSDAIDDAWDALEASARALAAVPAVEPVGEVVDMKYNSVRFYRKPNDPAAPYLQPGTKIYTTPIAQQASGVPAGFVLVPLSFLQGFHTLAHNYSLRAVPPDYYQGIQGDAFSNAYRRCGEDLAKLRAMLAAAPSPSAVQPADKLRITAELEDGDSCTIEVSGSLMHLQILDGLLKNLRRQIDGVPHPEAVQPKEDEPYQWMVSELEERGVKHIADGVRDLISAWNMACDNYRFEIKRRAALSEAQRAPLDEWQVMAMAKKAGFNLEPTANMLYTVRGNAAQVINLVHAVEAAHGIVTPKEPGHADQA